MGYLNLPDPRGTNHLLKGGKLIQPGKGIGRGGKGGTPKALASDPYWSSVGSLLEFDGTNGSTTFTDAKTKTWTAHGSAALTTTSPKIGTAMLSLNGSTDYINTPKNTVNDILQTGGASFTIEAWIYLIGTPNVTYGAVIAAQNTSISGWILRVYTGKAQFVFPGVIAYDWTTAFTVNTWYHVAMVRDAGTNLFKFYKDGTKIASDIATGPTNGYTDINAAFTIGKDMAGSYGYFPGYIDQFRLTKGVARYTGASFTPSTELFPTR